MAVFFQFDDTQITVNVPSRDQLLSEVSDRFTAGEGFALATINLDHLVKLKSSDTFRRAYARQDLIVADGNPIVWLGKMAGAALELLPGSDLVVPLAELAGTRGCRWPCWARPMRR